MATNRACPNCAAAGGDTPIMAHRLRAPLVYRSFFLGRPSPQRPRPSSGRGDDRRFDPGFAAPLSCSVKALYQLNAAHMTCRFRSSGSGRAAYACQDAHRRCRHGAAASARRDRPLARGRMLRAAGRLAGIPGVFIPADSTCAAPRTAWGLAGPGRAPHPTPGAGDRQGRDAMRDAIRGTLDGFRQR